MGTSAGRMRSAGFFTLLNVISGWLEIGSILYAAVTYHSVMSVLSVALAYQLGALVRNPLSLSTPAVKLLGAAAFAVGAAFLVGQARLAVCIFAVGMMLQLSRDHFSKGAGFSTFGKRLGRVAGFVLAPSFFFSPPVFFCFLLFLLLATPYSDSPSHKVGLDYDAYALAMVVHQSHYFIYASVLVYFFALMIPLGWVGAAFAGGWISYSIAPHVFRRLNSWKVLIAGHCLVAITLLAMWIYLRDASLLIPLWVVSGFGGGSVYALRALHAEAEAASDLDAFESIGHVTGVVLAVAFYLFLRVDYVFLGGGFLAIVTAAIAVRHLGGRRGRPVVEARSPHGGDARKAQSAYATVGGVRRNTTAQ